MDLKSLMAKSFQFFRDERVREDFWQQQKAAATSCNATGIHPETTGNRRNACQETGISGKEDRSCKFC